MNDKYIIAGNKCENAVIDGKTVGYEFRIRIPYYQGVPLSQVNFIKVSLDGEEVPQESISVFTVTGEELKLKEISTVSFYYWEYMEPLRVLVYKDGGLAKGAHRLDVSASIDVIYSPTGFATEAFCEFEI